MHAWVRFAAVVLAVLASSAQAQEDRRSYVIVGTGQTKCYNDRGSISPPAPGDPFYGQDAQHPGPKPSYKDDGDGTVVDLNTGLVWVQARGSKVTWDDAVAGAAECRVGGHDDWRMPTIKELYSLIDFRGYHDPQKGGAGSVPYLDAEVFGFEYGDERQGEREIDCQDWSATEYVETTMGGDPTVFGVNFADGRIKGYPKARRRPGGGKAAANVLYARYVRGNPAYGRNDLHGNDDGTVTDGATGLMWTKADSGKGLDWEHALAHAEALDTAGHDDWRLPNAKELQSIVDYGRVPAIDPVFEMTELDDGQAPFFWSSTTHLDGPPDRRGPAAVYVAFGRALGWMRIPPGAAQPRLLDVHGAGAQRSDPKSGDPAEFPIGRGPQGDVIRIFNHVRCVRDAGGS